MVKLLFDYGHGGRDSGAVYKGRREKDDVLKLGKAVKKEVERHNIRVDETRKGDENLTLQDRCNFENRGKYDFFISFHRNYYKDVSANGTEVFTYLLKKPKAVELANNINYEVTKTGLRNRGVKTANFKVLRSTKADAVLMEIGFISNDKDNKIFDDKFDEIVTGITKGILKTLKVTYKPKTQTPPKPVEVSKGFYRVVTDSYQNKDNAIQRQKELKKLGVKSFLAYYEK